MICRPGFPRPTRAACQLFRMNWPAALRKNNPYSYLLRTKPIVLSKLWRNRFRAKQINPETRMYIHSSAGDKVTVTFQNSNNDCEVFNVTVSSPNGTVLRETGYYCRDYDLLDTKPCCNRYLPDPRGWRRSGHWRLCSDPFISNDNKGDNGTRPHYSLNSRSTLYFFPFTRSREAGFDWL